MYIGGELDLCLLCCYSINTDVFEGESIIVWKRDKNIILFDCSEVTSCTMLSRLWKKGAVVLVREKIKIKIIENNEKIFEKSC